MDNSGTIYPSIDPANPGVPQTIVVKVANVPPTLSDVQLADAEINEDGFADLSGKISEPGVLDNFVLTVNWGDGSGPTKADIVTYDLAAGPPNFYVSPQVKDFGTYT